MTALDAAGDHHPGYGPMRSTGEHASAASQSLGSTNTGAGLQPGIDELDTYGWENRTQSRGRSRNDSQ